ncbi:MAG TPA: TetR/AcrR family transcriptional regulator [Acidimicrobiales bacterium]|nr:TetR/AcrR family transcriptional regulator [Acidimicrobiales bacterium]
MATSPRTRLDPDARRAQLVELGRRMLSTRPLDTVAIDEIAAEAGISRGLLFHYFPTKRDYHLAVARAAAQDLLRRTDPDPSLDALSQLRASVEAFVDYVSENRDPYTAFIRGAAGGDPEARAVGDATREAFTQRVLARMGADRPSPRLRVAVRGWVAFTEEVTVDRMAGEALDRDELVALIVEALVTLVRMGGGELPGPA